MHLVFYDGTCGLCDRVVQFLLKHDTHKVFQFAPLQGSTAQILLKDLPTIYKDIDSIVLIENYQHSSRHYFVMGKAAFRICWLLGGLWKIPGLLFFLPSFIYNWAYRLVAKNRHIFFPTTSCILPDPSQKDKFLP